MLKLAKGHFRDSLSAFEVMDRHSTMITFRAFPDSPAKYPFSEEYPFAMLIEVEAYDEDDRAEDRLLDFLERVGDLIEVRSWFKERVLKF